MSKIEKNHAAIKDVKNSVQESNFKLNLVSLNVAKTKCHILDTDKIRF